MLFLNGQLVTVSAQEVMVSTSVSDLTKVEAATAEAAKRAKVANCILLTKDCELAWKRKSTRCLATPKWGKRFLLYFSLLCLEQRAFWDKTRSRLPD